MLSGIVKKYFAIVLLAIAAGFLVYLQSFSVIFLTVSFFFLWFALERFEIALLFFIFYLPFQVALNVAPGFDMASGRVLILAFFGIWIVRSLKNKKLEIDFSPATIFLVLFLSFSVLSIGQAFETERALRKILVFFSVFPLYFVITSFSHRRDFILKIAGALLAGGTVISLLGILQFFAQFYFGINPIFDFFAKVIAPVFYGRTFAAEVVANPSWLVNVGGVTLLRSFSLFSDPHIFSFYIGLVAPIAFAFSFLPNRTLQEEMKKRKLARVAFPLLILAGLLTFSRGGYLGMAAAFCVLIVLFWNKFSSKQKKVWFGSFILAALVMLSAGRSVLFRFLSSFDFSEGSNVERMKNWRQGWEAFSDNIIQGVGIGNYSFYLDPTIAYRTPVYAHNLYLDLGAELGIFALMAWIFLIVATIWGLYVSSRRTEDSALSYLALGLIGSLVWFSVHSFFDTSVYAPNILAVFTVIISISALVIRYAKMEKKQAS